MVHKRWFYLMIINQYRQEWKVRNKILQCGLACQLPWPQWKLRRANKNNHPHSGTLKICMLSLPSRFWAQLWNKNYWEMSLFISIKWWFCYYLWLTEWCHEYSFQYPNPTRIQEEADKFMATFDQEQEKVINAFPRRWFCVPRIFHLEDVRCFFWMWNNLSNNLTSKYRPHVKLQLSLTISISKPLCDLLKAKLAEEESRGQPDEDGWITVGKGGRKPAASQKDAAELKEKKKKKKQVGHCLMISCFCCFFQ